MVAALGDGGGGGQQKWSGYKGLIAEDIEPLGLTTPPLFPPSVVSGWPSSVARYFVNYMTADCDSNFHI